MFVDPREFSFLRGLEASFASIRREALALPDDLLQPWVQRQMYGQGWSLAILNVMGQPVGEACARCPATAKAVESVDGLGMVAFSRLAPNTHVEPHIGWGHRVFRFHLGLVVPDHCSIRVGDETRHWGEGQSLGFDDTVEHEAWNRSGSDRWVLMLDVLRPGLTGPAYDLDRVPDEVKQLASMLSPDFFPS